jgi:Flp pilus assembly protein TadG
MWLTGALDRTALAVSDRGSTLLLYPAAVLVVFLLGGIAVDLSQLHEARAELVRVAGIAADDAAAQLDLDALHQSGEIRVDAARAETVVAERLASMELPGSAVGPPRIRVEGTVVTVELTRRIRHLFARVLPGDGTEMLTVEAAAELRPPRPTSPDPGGARAPTP